VLKDLLDLRVSKDRLVQYPMLLVLRVLLVLLVHKVLLVRRAPRERLDREV
jgi:hypothetical protein